MLFSYNWLQSFFREKLPNSEKLAELLTKHSFETFAIKQGRNNWVLDIDVLPNRAHDCFNHIGIGREIAVILNKKLKIPKTKPLKAIKSSFNPINVKIKCPKLVPRYSAIVVKDIKVKQSPQWLKQRLEVVGIRSINNIVDLTNYVMLETGQPMHAFDYDKIKEQKMILRLSKKGEKVVTLDGIEHNLDKEMLVIEDQSRLIDLVGIMGGKLSEVGAKTKNIVLQAGNFDRKTIYQTVKKLNHSTDASDIYIQGIDPNLTIFSLERAYFLLKKFNKAKIIQIIDIYPKKILPRKIKLDLDYVENLLGVKISKKKIIKILKSLNFKIIERQPMYLMVEVPTFRLDIAIQEDLIEEIGRIYGYQKIPNIFPNVSLISPQKNEKILWENIVKDSLKEAKFIEVYNYSFIGEEIIKIFKWKKQELIELKNPISVEQKYLQPSLIPNLLKNAKENLKYYKKLKIFELGKTFEKCKKQNLKQEKTMLSGLITGNEFYQLKGIVDLILNKLGISNIWYDEFQPTPAARLTSRSETSEPRSLKREDSKLSIWHPIKRAEIKINGEEIGFLGEIKPEILENLKIKDRVVVFDIDFEKLQKLATEEHQYQPISSYPAAIRDLAVLVPLRTKVADVLNIIDLNGGKLVRDVDLFDIYEGKEIGEFKKNLAFHIIYQAEDKTLSAKEINETHQKIVKALEKNTGWEVRR